MEWFIAGAIAGYALAVPVGAIAVLIIETAMERGLRAGLAAGAGTATVDLGYATLAALFGTVIAELVRPIEVPLRIASILILAFIALRGLRGLLQARRAAEAAAAAEQLGTPAAPDAAGGGKAGSTGGVLATYLRFIGLTSLNPATVTYFAALILGLPNLGSSALDRGAFVVGVGVASLSWQWVLGVVGAVLHHRLPSRFRLATSVVGNLVILGLAGLMATSLLQRI